MNWQHFGKGDGRGTIARGTIARFPGAVRFFWLAVVSGVCVALNPGNSWADERPNVLLVLAENISTELGCYGYPLVNTPNLDQLAKEGVRYTNAFTTASVCAPSRSAMALGAYQIKTNTHHLRMSRKRHLPEPYRLFTQYLREVGYYAALGCGYSKKTDLNFAPRGVGFDGEDWKDRRPGQPFVAQTTLHVTHRGRHWDEKDGRLPPISPNDVQLPPHIPDHPICREDWAKYLMQIQKMDAQVGDIMRRLEDEGLTDDTVFIFMADNGRDHARGMEWLYDPGIHVPMIIRWPGVLKGGTVCDDMISAVDVTATILNIAGIEPPEHMDGVPFLGPNARKREYVYAARDRIDERLDRIRCVRTKDYKYIRNFMPEVGYPVRGWIVEHDPKVALMRALHEQGELTPVQSLLYVPRKPEEELYDLRTDPGEYRNLAGDPEYRQVLGEMRKRLDAWVEETNDAGRHREKREESLEQGYFRYDAVYGIKG